MTFPRASRTNRRLPKPTARLKVVGIDRPEVEFLVGPARKNEAVTFCDNGKPGVELVAGVDADVVRLLNRRRRTLHLLK